MEEFLGKEYVQVSTENFDEYLTFIGLNYISRKIAANLKQEHSLTKNEDGTYTFSFKSKLVSTDTVFTPGEEFEETKADGVKVQALITLEGNKMTHIQIESNGRTSKHVREFFHDKLIVALLWGSSWLREIKRLLCFNPRKTREFVWRDQAPDANYNRMQSGPRNTAKFTTQNSTYVSLRHRSILRRCRLYNVQ